MPPKRKCSSRNKVTAIAKKSRIPATTTISSADGGDTKEIKTIVIKGKVPVDSNCINKVDSAHVFCTNEDVYNFMLNQTCLENNNNKYYLGQLLEDDDSKNYSCWFRWGRVGFTSQSSLTPFCNDLSKAMSIFEKKFREKTGNPWKNRKNFVKIQGKYDLIKQDFGDDLLDANDDKVEEEENKPIESALPEKVFDLVTLICNIQNIEQAMREMNYDAKKAPLGKLTVSQIKAGYEALSAISDCVKMLEDSERDESSNVQLSKRIVKNTAKIRNDLRDACDRFYTRIPHNFGMRVPPLINTLSAVRDELDLMKALEELEVAFSIIKRKSNEKINPVDRHYAGLQCELKPLANNDKMLKIIKNYLEWTHAPTHSGYQLKVLNVFTCNKQTEAESFEDYGRRFLLWHGSRLTNWMGILGRGLRIAPPEAPCNGYMFGKGVYFADCSSKSANYICCTRDRNIGVMALCEVSLGQSNELLYSDYNADKLPAGMHSVKGIGQNIPDPKMWITLDDGLVVPCGKIVPVESSPSPSLLYNEYIVYKREQIRLRYLVQLKFEYQ